MFREFRCGCIISEQCGRVRICPTHALSRTSRDGFGGLVQAEVQLRGKVKYYPAHGEPVPGWSGR